MSGKSVEAVELYEVYTKEKLRMDRVWNVVKVGGPYRRMYKALEKVEEVKEEERKKLKGAHMMYWDSKFEVYIKPIVKRADEVSLYEKRPPEIVNLEDIKPIEDVCGTIRELVATENISLAYVTLKPQTKAKSHEHKIMDEMYYVTKGYGRIHLGDKSYYVERGDSVKIPKNTKHHLEADLKGMEVLVATTPKFTLKDVIEKD